MGGESIEECKSNEHDLDFINQSFNVQTFVEFKARDNCTQVFTHTSER